MVVAFQEGYCKEYYEKQTCKYGKECKFAHIGRQSTVSTVCKYCKGNSTGLCLTDCNHVACLNCMVLKFNQDGRCLECEAYTHGRFYPV